MSPSPSLPLMRLTALQSVVSSRLVGPSGYPLPASLSPFLTETAVSTGCRPPPTFAGGFILSELRPSSEYCPVEPASRPALRPYREAPSLGFLALIATSARSVLQWTSQSPPPSILGVSHALDGLLRRVPCGFVSPHSHVQGSPFRGLFPAPSLTTSSMAVPSRRWRRSAANGCPPAPQLVASPSRPSSGCGSVARPSVVSRRSSSIPSWDFPPPGFPSRRRGGAFTSPPLMAFKERPSSRPLS